MRWNDTASIGSKKARLEIKGAKKVASGDRKGNSNGPNNKLRRIRRDTRSRRKELDVTIIHDAVDGACIENRFHHLWLPAAAWRTHCFIGRMLQHEFDMVDARRGPTPTHQRLTLEWDKCQN